MEGRGCRKRKEEGKVILVACKPATTAFTESRSSWLLLARQIHML